jgi:hypothetical protein
MKAAMLIGRGQIIHNTEQAPESRGKLQGPQLLPSLSTGSASGSHYSTPALRKSNRPGSQSPHPGQSRPKFSRKAQRPTAQTLCLEPLRAPRPKRPNGCCSLAGPAFEPPWATFTHCPAFYPIAPTVEQAARLAMRAAGPAEQHNPERYGGSNAIRRQDWRRGTQDCVLHFKGPPAVEHAARLAVRAVTPAEQHNPERYGGPTPSAAKTGGVARKTACSTSRGCPQWSMPPGLPCGRPGRQSNTIPSGTGGPTPSAAKTGGVARKTARSTSRGRPQWSMPPGLPCGRSRRQSNTIPSGTGGQRHPPPRLAAWHARLRAPPQGAARSGASRQACHAGGRRQSDTIPSVTGGPTPSAAKTGGVARKTACSTSRGRPQWSMPPGLPCGRPGRQSNTTRASGSSQRHPPPRLAAWHARLRAPLEGVARKTACSTSRGRPQWSMPPGLPCGRPGRQSHTIPSCPGFGTPSAAKTGGVARKTACSTSRGRPQWSMPPSLPCGRSGRQSDTIPSGTGGQRQPPPRLAAWHARLRAPLEGVARKTACSTSRGRPQWSMPPGLPCGRPGRQSNTTRAVRGANAIRRQDWRRGTQDCVLHLKAWHARLRAPPQGAARSGACRQACRAGGRAGRATRTRAVR